MSLLYNSFRTYRSLLTDVSYLIGEESDTDLMRGMYVSFVGLFCRSLSTYIGLSHLSWKGDDIIRLRVYECMPSQPMQQSALKICVYVYMYI